MEVDESECLDLQTATEILSLIPDICERLQQLEDDMRKLKHNDRKWLKYVLFGVCICLSSQYAVLVYVSMYSPGLFTLYLREMLFV